MSQLGISPLYPPQENFFVGDLWAIVTRAPNPRLLGRGVRIGHIDLTEAIKSDHSGKSAIENMFSDDDKKDAPVENPTKKLKMFSLAFPGVSVSNTGDNSASSYLPFFTFGSSRKSSRFDELKIPLAETYGSDSVESMIKVYSYCEDEKTQVKCTDDFARNILSANLDANIGPSSSKKLEYDVRLQLITRVYLTRSITHRRVISGDVTFDARSSLGGPTEKSASRGGDGTSAAQPLMMRRGGDSNDIMFDEKFATPLVFGFRSAIFVPR